MKYIIMQGDGMADEAVPELGYRTPLEVAAKPVMDALAAKGEVGLVATTPAGMETGSVTTNLAIMGYDPRVFYTGRSPLEAASMGIDLKETDVTLRTNLVYLSEMDNFADRIMVDYSADEITTREAAQLMADLERALGGNGFVLHAGVSYRHCTVWDQGSRALDLTPPHEIPDRRIGDHLPRGEGGDLLLDLMERSVEVLRDHPVNLARQARGLRPANAIWFWGAGHKPAMPTLEEKYGKRGAMVSAVDLLKGIGIYAGLDIIEVEGATGNLDTNFEGKAQAAVEALQEGLDFVFIHVEAPDECGHRHEVENKVKAIEFIDARLLKHVVEALEKAGEPFHLLVLPDHPTPLTTRVHSDAPVPYILYRSEAEKASGVTNYNENTAKATGKFVDRGDALLDMLFA